MIVSQEDELEQERQVRRLEERLRRLTIIGTPETLVAGNLEQGYSVDTHREKEPIGACCVGSDCTVITEQECTNAGGTYQGDWTDCDPNPCGGCPCLTVTFHDVAFDCGCMELEAGDGNEEITDFNFNDTALPLVDYYNCADHFGCVEGCATCLSYSLVYSSNGDPLSITDASGIGECVSPITLLVPDIAVAEIGGVWHVAARLDNKLLFYGTTLDLSVPVANEIVSCDPTKNYLVNDLTTCLSVGPRRWDNILLYKLTYGGTATVTVGDHCGACCEEGAICDHVSPEVCDLFGGTYQGDGTNCNPNLCP